MSSVDGNGKGNLLITYLFKSNNMFNQVYEEAELKLLITSMLEKKGYKYVIADDVIIDKQLKAYNEEVIDKSITNHLR